MVQVRDEALSGDPAAYVQARLRRLPLFARELIAGGCAGGLAKTCMAPLERTKIIFQTRGSAGMTVGGVLTQIWQQEGLQGLFRGNTASVMRIVPYAAIHFGLYEYYRRGIISLVIPDSQPGSREQGTPTWDLLAGSASGATAVLATYPLDLVRTRLAWATEAPAAGSGTSPWHHHGIWSQLKTSISEEGVVGLYRGCTPTLLGILPYAGLKFYVYQALKHEYRAWIASQSSQEPPAKSTSDVSSAMSGQAAATSVQSFNAEPITAAVQDGATDQQGQQQGSLPQPPAAANQKLPIHVTLVFGGVAGLAAQTVTYPLDVIRRQMQVAHLKHSAAEQQTRRTTNNSNGSACSTRPSQPQSAQAWAPAKQQTAGLSHNSSRYGSSSSSSSKVCGQQIERLQSVQALTSSSGTGMIRQCLSIAAASRIDKQTNHTQTRLHEVLRPTMIEVAQKLWAEGGMKAFFRGLSINYMKVVPSTAVGFTVYDAFKSYLGLTSTL